MLQGKTIEKSRYEKPAIVVNNVTKEFIIPHEKKTTLFENIKSAFNSSTYEKFVAVKDVSFIVNRGESVGIIGDNGSGKSTLLKIIARILRPTSGNIQVNGKITPFLELGVGFQPDLTARENIEVYSTVMGLSDKEIAKNMDGVLEFAGLTKFADTKLKNFSSGMQVRLAFATAIQREPDILIVDEVLAVGDMDFQHKCLDTFQRYKDNNVTILFVSHDLNSIRRFCDKTLLLNNGRVVTFGNSNDVIDRYVYKMNMDSPDLKTDDIQIARALGQPDGKSDVKESTSKKEVESKAESISYILEHRAESDLRWGNKKLEITNVKLLTKNSEEGEQFISGDPMTISMDYNVKDLIKNPIFGFDISDEKGNNCFGTNTLLKGKHIKNIEKGGNIKVNINEIPLLQGKYYLSVAAQSEDFKITYDWHNKKYQFYVVSDGNEEGLVHFKCDFEINTSADDLSE